MILLALFLFSTVSGAIGHSLHVASVSGAIDQHASKSKTSTTVPVVKNNEDAAAKTKEKVSASSSVKKSKTSTVISMAKTNKDDEKWDAMKENSPRARIAAFLDKQEDDDDDDCTCTETEKNNGDCDCDDEEENTESPSQEETTSSKNSVPDVLGKIFSKVHMQGPTSGKKNGSTNPMSLQKLLVSDVSTNPGDPLNSFDSGDVAVSTPPVNTTVGETKSALEVELDGVLSNIERLRQEIALWSDHDSWNAKIAADKAAVEKETTPGLADMLADIRYEMHQLAVPTFVEVLTEKIELLQAREKELRKQIEEEKTKKQKNAKQEQAATASSTGGESRTDASSTGRDDKGRTSWLLLFAVFLAGALCVLVFFNCSDKNRRAALLRTPRQSSGGGPQTGGAA